MTEAEAEFLLGVRKEVVRPFAWTKEASGHTPTRYIFESSVRFDGHIPEGVVVRAHYRSAKEIKKGQAKVTLPESFDCALFSGNNRISAFDTNAAQRHVNRVGAGRPYYALPVPPPTHEHIWVGEYGYAEPILPLLDVIDLLNSFAARANFTFKGTILHPLRGQQWDLGL